MVGQGLAPNTRVLMNISKHVRVDVRSWASSEEGDKWTVILDVRDLGDHLDVNCRGASLATPVRLVIRRLTLVAALHLDSQGRCGGVRAMFIAGALHGVEASSFSQGSLLKLRVYCLVFA